VLVVRTRIAPESNGLKRLGHFVWFPFAQKVTLPAPTPSAKTARVWPLISSKMWADLPIGRLAGSGFCRRRYDPPRRSTHRIGAANPPNGSAVLAESDEKASVNTDLDD
jgi:hypothetical protein